MRVMRAALLCAVSALVFAACGKVPSTHFYTIDAPQVTAQTKTFPYTLAVVRLRVADKLAQDRLIYMPSPFQVGYYTYHRWVGLPGDMVTAALVTSLRRSSVFQTISEMRSGLNPDYILQGTVDNLEELDSPDAQARVAMSLSLTDAKTHVNVWAGSASFNRPVTKGDVDEVAKELNECARLSIEKLTRDLAAAQLPEKK